MGEKLYFNGGASALQTEGLRFGRDPAEQLQVVVNETSSLTNEKSNSVESSFISSRIQLTPMAWYLLTPVGGSCPSWLERARCRLVLKEVYNSWEGNKTVVFSPSASNCYYNLLPQIKCQDIGRLAKEKCEEQLPKTL